MRADPAQPVRLADYRPPDHLIDAVYLDIRLHPTQTLVRAQLSIRPNPKGLPGAPLMLDGDGLTAKDLRLDGRPLDLSLAKPEGLILADPPPGDFTLSIETVLDPSANTQLMGLYKSGSAYCTQCEAEGFRRITYFMDRPDVLSVYTTRLEAERAEAPVLLANGNPADSGPIEGTDRHFAIWRDPHPKPCYLFALVGGDLGVWRDEFTTLSGRRVELGVYVEHGKEERAGYAMDALKRAMKWDEEVFGREYDLDVFNIVAVSDFNMGAMENKGLNIFNDKYVLALPQTATDADYAGVEAVIAHEYFHNWTGNRITCRDWFQLCLKEGLTVYRDQEFSSDQRSRAVKRIADVRALRAQQFPEDAGPLAHNVRPEAYLEINNFYTPTVYEKGAEIVRALENMIGSADFRRGMDLYFARCDGAAATVEDFIACFAETSGRSLSDFMRWYKQAGTPVLRASASHDPAAQTFTLELAQSTAPTPGQAVKQPLLIPIALGLLGRDGNDLPLITRGPNEPDGATPTETSRGVFELTGESRRITFLGVAHPPVPSLLRGFSAPVRLEANLTEADLLLLLAHDSDALNRWQASQTYATRLILRSIDDIRSGANPKEDAGFLAAMGAVLDKAEQDRAFASQIMSLPSEADIAQEIGVDVDPDAIHVARDALRASLGKTLRNRLLKARESVAHTSPYSPDAASAGGRSLANAALDLLAAGNPAEGRDLAARQFRGADNMTDRAAALAVLSRIPGEERERAFDAFFDAYASDALVIDKWFALQAMIPEPETLDRVRRLMHHESFTL
ncbi:MAG TPA: aminopeptidase N, partial [Beijerinckiaceae bacterium]|nr:aminopeptidase N [Beijerinckiaceae bacterium]